MTDAEIEAMESEAIAQNVASNVELGETMARVGAARGLKGDSLRLFVAAELEKADAAASAYMLGVCPAMRLIRDEGEDLLARARDAAMARLFPPVGLN